MSGLRVVAFGGGVQSVSMLVLAAQQKIDFQTFLIANVGDDSEYWGTLTYLHHIAMPYAVHHGLEIHELHRIKRTGEVETLFGRMQDRPRALPIPIRGSETGKPGARSCTADFKIGVLGKWLKAHGASENSKAVVAVGISLDEIHRINARKAKPYEILAYPLVGIEGGKAVSFGDQMYRRADCEQVIIDEIMPEPLAESLRAPEVFSTLAKVTQDDLRESGFSRMPRPPKSACFFCPFHRPSEWQRQRREEPELFQQSVDLENLLNTRRDSLGRDPVYLTRFGKPLAEAIPYKADPYADDDIDDPSCDNGWCMT